MRSSFNFHHQRRLLIHTSVLVSLYALPLACLAFYFLSTGLYREVAVATKERAGLTHLRQAVSILKRAVTLTWSETGDDESSIDLLGKDISKLGQLEPVFPAPQKLEALGLPPGAESSKRENIDSLWKKVQATAPKTPARSMALKNLVGQLNENIFQAADTSGLGSGAENEIGALTDVVAVSMPLYLERLLHMHERMSSDLHSKGWDPATIEAATIFSRQIQQEDLTRMDRSITAALRSDLHSAHVMPSFQSDYPAQAKDLMDGLRRLSEGLKPEAPGQPPSLDPLLFDSELKIAFESAATGWDTSIEHLDALVTDQINEALAHRNEALLLALALFVALLPLCFFYHRAFIHPVVQAMILETIQNKEAAEQARRAEDESVRHLQQTQAALDDHCAVFVADLQHRIVTANDRMSRLSGYSREELLGKPFSSLTREGDIHLKDLFGSVEQGRVWSGNLCHENREGKPFWVHATVFPFRNSAGEPLEFVVIETDITELVESQKTAENALQAKGQFLAMMSHEIRTPMNGIIGFAQLLAETQLDDHQRDYARTILTSGESLLVIINDILDYSKLEAGRTELEKRPLALRLLTEDVLDLFSAQARAKKLELVYWIEPDVPEGILGDETRLRQILLNLVGNAVKFTPAGHVEISITHAPQKAGEPRCLSFHVRDTGIGIPEDRREKLFRAFSQIDSSVTRTYGGTGLGLAISQRLVRLMGGAISVSSKPGRGSDFHFDLPVEEADATELLRARALITMNMEKTLRGKRILIVDDLQANRRLLANILETFGAETVSVSSVQAAEVEIRKKSYDLAVLDYAMPGETGIDLALKIRKYADLRALPLVLAASVHPEPKELPEGLFEAVILKPIRKMSFAMAMAKAIINRKHSPANFVTEVIVSNPSSFADKHPLQILVTDDNPVNLKVITATLRSLGYSPLVFENATSALAKLSSSKVDLVLMDVQMPGIDGHEATRRLRSGAAGETNRDTRIIALTAGAMAEERAACLAAGMDDFMSKPIVRAELLEKLAAAKS